MKSRNQLLTADKTLIQDVRRMIEEARSSVAIAVNTGLTMLYWRIGRRINQEVLKEGRAEYGKGILATLSQELSQNYGNGFSYSALTRMVKFYESFQDKKILSTLSQQLSWSHFRELLPLEKPLQRDFYAEMCRIERWSVRTLRQKIDSMLYERTALSKKPDELIRLELDNLRNEDLLTPDLVFRDPYFLDFLGLKDRYMEKDLEDAILRELEQFLLELGGGFSFIARQKRIQIDSDDYYLDLLFFHRKLKRLVAIELKLGDFKPAHKGQMEIYLRWLDKYERQSGEKKPIGLILCAGKKQETVELLELEKSSIRVAEPPMDYGVAPKDKSNMSRYLFGGFKRCLYPVQKFDSDAERKLTAILERDALKWFKPAKGQFQIIYRHGADHLEYIPDFVAETTDMVFMLEPKAGNQMEDPIVMTKKEAALKWCAHASDHAQNHGGKPWGYVLIPHNEIATNITLSALTARFGLREKSQDTLPSRLQ